MGFPTWTLWGMGFSAFGALICIALAYIALSPNLAQRNRSLAARLVPRLRMLTGTSLALLLMGMGFFLAGVPLEGEAQVVPTAVAGNSTPTNSEAVSDTAILTSTVTLDAENSSTQAVTPQPTSSTPESGAFARPSSAADSDNLGASPPITPTATLAPLPTSTASPTPTPSNTPTPSPTPTMTPTPTYTPTPYSGDIATVTLGGGTIWLRQSPADQAAQLVVVADNTAVIPTGRRANLAGIGWTEVQTGDGVTGWIRTEFLIGDTIPTPTTAVTTAP